MKQNILLASLLIIGIEVFSSDKAYNQNNNDPRPLDCLQKYEMNNKHELARYRKSLDIEHTDNFKRRAECCCTCWFCCCSCIIGSFLYMTEPKKL